MSIESVMPSKHLSLWCPLLLLHSILPSIRVFSNESVLCIRWPKYWSIWWLFRIDFLEDVLVWSPCSPSDSQESSPTPLFKIWILQCSAFFMVQLLHSHMTTGKTIALTTWILVGKVISLPFNNLSRLVINILPRRKCFLISRLQSLSAVILEHPQNKVSHCFHCFPIYFPWGDGTRCHDLSILVLSVYMPSSGIAGLYGSSISSFF